LSLPCTNMTLYIGQNRNLYHYVPTLSGLNLQHQKTDRLAVNTTTEVAGKKYNYTIITRLSLGYAIDIVISNLPLISKFICFVDSEYANKRQVFAVVAWHRGLA